MSAIRRAAANGSEAAIKRLASQPELKPWLRDVWAAFWRLSTCRDVGMGSGPIPWTAVNDYAIRYRIRGDDFEEFETLISAMDKSHMDLASAKQASG